MGKNNRLAYGEWKGAEWSKSAMFSQLFRQGLQCKREYMIYCLNFQNK